MSLQPPGGVKASEAPQQIPATQEQVQSVLDLEDYPNAKVVQNFRRTSPDYSPDEARFELIRKSEDAPDKVVKFYEEKLKATATGTADKREVWGKTQRGNAVQALVESDGAGSKITLVVISYMK